MPNNIEDYVHRIGRTGRAGATGTAYSYFTADNSRLARDLIKILEEAKQEVDPQLFDISRMPSSGGKSRFGRGGGSGGSSRFNPYSRGSGSNSYPSSRGGGDYGSSGYGGYGGSSSRY